MYNLFIDDSRDKETIAKDIEEPYDESLETVLVKNRAQLEEMLQSNGPPAFISFDFHLDPQEKCNVLNEGLIDLIVDACLANQATLPLFDVHSNDKNAASRINEAIALMLEDNEDLRAPDLEYDLIERRRTREATRAEEAKKLPDDIRAILGR